MISKDQKAYYVLFNGSKIILQPNTERGPDPIEL